MRRHWSLTALPAVALAATLPAQPAGDSSVVRIAGDAAPGRPTYVLLSGIVGGVAGLRRLQARLADSARVVAIDPYRASVKAPDVTFAAIARRVDSIMGRHEIESAHIVAHAHGAGVALRLAASAPGRVAALYFLDVGALDSSRTKVFSAALRLAPLIVHLPGGRGFIRGRLLRGLRQHSGCHDWLDSTTQRLYSEPLLDHIGDAVAMAGRLARAREPEPVSDVVSRLRSPVTVILGGAPHGSAPDSAELARLETLGDRLRVHRLPAVGHFPHEEAPDEVAALILARHSGGRREGTASTPREGAGSRCAQPSR